MPDKPLCHLKVIVPSEIGFCNSLDLFRFYGAEEEEKRLGGGIYVLGSGLVGSVE